VNAPPLSPDLLWFVRLGIEQGVFTRVQCVRVRADLGGAPGLQEFAQRMIDDDVVVNVEALERLAGRAAAKALEGPPAADPFVPADDLVEDIVVAPSRKSAAGPPPSFPFEAVPGMSDKALAEGVRELLAATGRHEASDLHLCAGRRPFIRKNRLLSYISEHTIGAEEALRLNTALLTPEQRERFLHEHDLDCAVAPSTHERYRVNIMFQKDGCAASYRIVPKEVRTLTALGFSGHIETLKRLLSYHNGLVLVTGPVGSGKTTTLAAMVEYLNETRRDHIITVEDPIEFVLEAQGCTMTQRQVGTHTKTFFTALMSALREDPDIIVIGELRDLETIEMAVTAAETGHLVIGTMHTSDAATTLNRLLDVFPAMQQPQIRSSVAESLRGIICQRLLPAVSGGLVMACEILVNTMAIANLVRDGKTIGLRNAMETGIREGMCLMDGVVFSLWQDGKISQETALANISNRVIRARIYSS